MKKIIILLLAIFLILSACAAPEEITQESLVHESVTEPAAAQPEAIEITMENWQDYFELRETEQVHLNDSCSVINRIFGYGVFLKEEYTDRLAEGTDVSFELEYNIAWGRVMGDLTGDSYIVMDMLSSEDRQTKTAGLTDFRGSAEVAEESDFYNRVAAEFAFDSEYGA